jgi:replicative DNA helicase
MSEPVYLPPQNIEAERAVLGGVLMDNKAILDLPAELKPEAFYLPSHGTIFHAMLRLWGQEAPIDVVSVEDKVRASGYEILASSLMEIQNQGMPASIAYHAGLVIAAFRQRRVINLLCEALSQMRAEPQRYDEIMAQLYSENDRTVHSRATPIQTVMIESLKHIEKNGDCRAIIPTGFVGLDKQVGGFERGELIVIGGRPSMGKTSFGLDLGLNAAERGYFVLIVSVETSREKLGIRMLSRETKLNSRKFRTGSLDSNDCSRLTAASGKLAQLRIHVLDREADWENIKREIRRHARDDLDLVILDYLTLLNLPSGQNDRRDLAVGRVANEAKRLAVSLNLGFVLISQLNRKTEDRNDHEPLLSDLRDSGDIEQAADIIIFPFRPIVYDSDFRPKDKAFLKVAKARDLPTGKIPVRFNAEITSFSDWT